MKLTTGARHAVIVKTSLNRYSVALAVLGGVFLYASSLAGVSTLGIALHALGFGLLYFDYKLTKHLVAENIESEEKEKR